MIDLLVLTNERDYSIDRVIHWLRKSEPRLRVRRVNRENPAMLGRLSALLGQSGWEVQRAVPRVAWLRQFLPERDPYGSALSPSEIDDLLVCRRQWLAWTDLFSVLGTRWINYPAQKHRAESKIRQLSVAGQAGFAVPRTLLTYDLEEAQAFVAQIGPCVVKSIATAFWEFSDQSFVFTTDAEKALVFNGISWQAQPVFLQERINGSHEARVFVIGRNVLGAHRRRVSLDWRTDQDIAWTPWSPDRKTTERALAYARAFELDYGAFDFILGSLSHPGPVFLECNPAGEFGFLDDVLERQPSQMIGKFLKRLVSDTSQA